MVFKGFRVQEDGRKVVTAFLTSAFAVLVLHPHLEWTQDYWIPVIIAGARGLLAFLETSSVPADQVATVLNTADKDNVQKVIEAKVKTAQAQDLPLKFITPEDVKEKL